MTLDGRVAACCGDVLVPVGNVPSGECGWTQAQASKALSTITKPVSASWPGECPGCVRGVRAAALPCAAAGRPRRRAPDLCSGARRERCPGVSVAGASQGPLSGSPGRASPPRLARRSLVPGPASPITHPEGWFKGGPLVTGATGALRAPTAPQRRRDASPMVDRVFQHPGGPGGREGTPPRVGGHVTTGCCPDARRGRRKAWGSTRFPVRPRGSPAAV